MPAKEAGRVLVNLPASIGNLLRDRAKANYRSTSAETVMLIERGLAAEKMASNHTA